MKPDAPEPEADDEDAITPPEDDEPPRSPWGARGLIAAALGLWGVVVWMRVGPPGLEVRPAALHGSDDDDARDRVRDRDRGERALGEGIDADEEAASARRSGSDAGNPARAVDEAPRDPRERLEGKRSAWAQGIHEPDVIPYVIKRGGAMKMVANLYKLHYHEIQALNPGVDLERELAPGTKLTVWRRPDEFTSESVGYAGDGRLVGGVPMLDGPGRILRMEPWKSFATAHTVAVLDAVLKEWGKRFPEDRPLLVGNMSQRTGGRLRPHSTHQSGRDVDLSYPQKVIAGEEYNWREMNAQNLDADRTWDLLELLVESGQVELVLIDSALQKLLYDHAVATGKVPKAELGSWLEYPRRPGEVETIVRHHAGHVDHLHVRLRCQPAESQCKSRERE
ncbi:MAG: penicillin-insensitive murein endopeptidase [Nannocystaceae bacterium]